MQTPQGSIDGVDQALQKLRATLEAYQLCAETDQIASNIAPTPMSDPLPADPASSSSQNSSEALLSSEILTLRIDTPIPQASKHEFASINSSIRLLFRNDLAHYAYLVPAHLVLARKYIQLGYHDLAAGQAYKALLICDILQDASDDYHDRAIQQQLELIRKIPLSERINLLKGELRLVSTSLNHDANSEIDIELDCWVRKHYLPLAYLYLCRSLVLCGCFASAREYILRARSCQSLLDDDRFRTLAARLPAVVATHTGLSLDEARLERCEGLPDWPDEGMVRREPYPWDDSRADQSRSELPALNAWMASVAPKLEVRATELPTLTGNGDKATNVQLGVFAMENIAPGEIVLSETSVLTAQKMLDHPVCECCGADLPGLEDPAANSLVGCSDCETTFCGQACVDRAQNEYHPPICGIDVDYSLRDVQPSEAADSLYALLLLRTIAMSRTQQTHPLQLKEVKYIWSDFHDVEVPENFAPPPTDFNDLTPSDANFGNLPRTLPFSFKYNILLPIMFLEKMEIDFFASQDYDIWVFNNLYAKFRATASARLSGQGGGQVRGPEVAAVHPLWCMANHSCDPNVTWEWGGTIDLVARKERVIWKGKEGDLARSKPGIRKGEEILNHYCDVSLPVKERREWAKGALGGDCMCPRCVWESGLDTGEAPDAILTTTA